MENKIKELRIKAGLKQAELAKMLNVTQGNLSAWELGRWEPSANDLIKLGKIFNCSVDYLLNQNISSHSTQQENTVRIVGRGGVVKEYKVSDKERKMFERMLETVDDDPDLKF